MEDIALKLLTVWGPLALGWAIVPVLWLRLVKLEDKYVTLSAESIAVWSRVEIKIDARQP